MQNLLVRNNLSSELVAAIRERALAGDLKPGSRINEVALARELGVSRTPLREALARLAADGVVISQPRIGFSVPPLSPAELEQLYPIRAVLDPGALRMAGLPDRARIQRLRKLNDKLGQATDPVGAVELDERWHLELLGHCPNKLILDLIRHFMWRTKRYELALMRSEPKAGRASGDHERIIAALEAGDLDAACLALELNMRSGLQPLLDRLAAKGGLA